MKSPCTVLLVDGDILLYRFAHTNERTIQWDADIMSEVVSPEKAAWEADQFIEHLKEVSGCSKVVVCMTGDLNFRYEVLPTYKHNRVGKEKPQLYHTLKQHFNDKYPTRYKLGLEADDVMGILATRTPNKYMIASADKDLRSIPCWLLDWKTGEVEEITEEMADLFFYTQVLTGDSSDGYSGCPGIGPKKASKFFSEVDPSEWWAGIVAHYELKGLTEDDAIQQARVARILRAEDYDFDNQEVILWSPSSS